MYKCIKHSCVANQQKTLLPDTPNKLAITVKSNLIMAEDIIREAGYMLYKVLTLRDSCNHFLSKADRRIPKETVEKLLKAF